jgi:hypothetical protein
MTEVFERIARFLPRGSGTKRISFRDPLLNACFLEYLAGTGEFLLHGSMRSGLTLLEPRTPFDIGGIRRHGLFATGSLPYAVAWVITKIFGYGHIFDFDYSVRIFGRTLRSKALSISRPALQLIDRCPVPVYVCPAEPFARFRDGPPPPVERLTMGAVRRCPEYYVERPVEPFAWVPVTASLLPCFQWIHQPGDAKPVALVRNLVLRPGTGP